ncbi:MAG: hypothetical protein KatS3mg111_0820 [Pirellulaceae bacterium]|nr:MAG: hypothetical protein KatS3mg111_0820 [Pirellulaceae bacterium]
MDCTSKLASLWNLWRPACCLCLVTMFLCCGRVDGATVPQASADSSDGKQVVEPVALQEAAQQGTGDEETPAVSPSSFIDDANGNIAANKAVAPSASSEANSAREGSGEPGFRTRQEANFPGLEAFQRHDPPIELESPRGRRADDWMMGTLKFVLALALLWIWLRALELRGIDASHPALVSPRWDWILWGSGVVALLVLLLFPPLMFAVPLAYAVCLIPFARYTAWRNAAIAGRRAPIGWIDLIRLPVGDRKAVELENLRAPLQHRLDSAGEQGEMQLLPTGDASRRSGGQPQTHKPALDILMEIIDRAVADRATDLHINTRADGKVVVRMRVDGKLFPLTELPAEIGRPLINVVRVVANLKLTDRRQSQDGRFRADRHGRRLCFRVSSQVTATGDKISIRILDPAIEFADFASLGMPPDVQRSLERALHRAHGLILIVGSSGAGKSTTAYAALQRLNTGDLNIVTIEDPIEYFIPDVDQIEINQARGQSFATALRSALRLDSDVIFIGEIRDEETARIALQAASSGQLVLATMHAMDSISAIARMMDLGGDRHLVAATLRAIVAQTLVRLTCPRCGTAQAPLSHSTEGPPETAGAAREFDRSDCPYCNGRGFFRRTGVFEILEVDAQVRAMIYAGEPLDAVERYARSRGMRRLEEEAATLLERGDISPEEYARQFEELVG